MAAHNELGKEGELLAANHLQSEGYVIRHRNWRCGHKELDIVAEKDGTLVFVEVKTRKDVYSDSPKTLSQTGKYDALSVRPTPTCANTPSTFRYASTLSPS